MDTTACRRNFFPTGRGVQILAALFAFMTLCACSTTSQYPVGHVKRALDPAGFAQAASGPDWDVAAVKVAAGPGGIDYSSTGLMPVLLVLKNKSSMQPQVILEDVRAVGNNAEYLVYGADEAMRLATAASFKRKAVGTAKGGAVGAGVGAALGAGAGAALYFATGQKNPEYLWLGAAGGGAAGGLAGAALSDSSFSKAEQDAMRADLTANAWQEDPITPGTTRTGYLLVPAGLNISRLRVAIRADAGAGAGTNVVMDTRTLTIASDKDYNPELAGTRPPQGSGVQTSGAQAPGAVAGGTPPTCQAPAAPRPSSDLAPSPPVSPPVSPVEESDPESPGVKPHPQPIEI